MKANLLLVVHQQFDMVNKTLSLIYNQDILTFELVFVPAPSFEAVYCLICSRQRVAVARYRTICLVLIKSLTHSLSSIQSVQLSFPPVIHYPSVSQPFSFKLQHFFNVGQSVVLSVSPVIHYPSVSRPLSCQLHQFFTVSH